MAYLGVVGTTSNTGELAYSRFTIASAILGAIIGQFATVVGYYFGSSESSQKKDATIAGALPQPQPEPPPPMIPARRAP